MKFSEWIKIREIAVQNPNAPGVKKPPEPGEAARKLKTRFALLKTRSDSLGKPPQAQIAALKNTAKKLATDPSADDDSMDQIDDEVKKIQNKSGIKV
jgi:hypothetical protein